MAGILNSKWLLSNIRQNFRYALFFLIFFYVIYGGASYYSSLQEHFHSVDFDWEQNIPFFPEASIIYLSSGLLVSLLVAVVNTEYEIQVATVALMIVTSISGLFFMLYPVSINFPEREVFGWAAIPFSLADAVNLQYNSLPSLHVGLSFTVTLFIAYGRRLIIKIALHSWTVLISLSTLLIHEHHFLDVVAGFALSLSVYWLFAKPCLSMQQS